MRTVLAIFAGWHIMMLVLASSLPVLGLKEITIQSWSIEPNPSGSIFVLTLIGGVLYLLDRRQKSRDKDGLLIASRGPRWWWPGGRIDD